MANANYVLLEKITVGAAGASSVTFSGIPQTGYTDLVVQSSTRDGTTADNNTEFRVKFNGSATSYSNKYLQGNGSSASSGTYGTAFLYTGETDSNTATASTFGSSTIYIPNYTSSNYKSVSSDLTSEENTSVSYATLTAGLWSNTAAITSIEFTCNGSFAQYSTFYLYGVAKLGTTPAIVPYATGGDTIMTDGTYWYHTFVSSGTFTPQKGLTCDYLVVAGGGGGASDIGGGGGAGGYRTSIGGTALSLGTSAVTVTVGGGGAAGTNGSNSVFSTITSTGGGRGGSAAGTPSVDGANGGSGGGSSRFSTVYGTGNTPSTTPSQGNNGGIGVTTGAENPYHSGGGGGASAVGASVAPTNGTVSGAGGAGSANSISGSSVTYAGGGGGGAYSGTGAGAGGAGGGGAGSNSGTGTAGTVNLGGGGGGGKDSGGVGGAGGSGIVIVRYAV
jgi:hypothetical protein